MLFGGLCREDMQMSLADKMEQVSRLVMKSKKYHLLQQLVKIDNEEELKSFYKKNELSQYLNGGS